MSDMKGCRSETADRTDPCCEEALFCVLRENNREIEEAQFCGVGVKTSKCL